MIYLYVKIHNKTGLKYLGKTESPDPFKYPGSGTRWVRHWKKHGKDMSTKILLATESEEELIETGLFFSKLWDVVNSPEWANFIPEGGDGVSSEWATKENLRRVKEGVHPFSGPENNRKTREKRNETRRKNGTHNFLGGDVQRKRIADGTHHLLGGDVQRKANAKRVKAGEHNFQRIGCVSEEGSVYWVTKEEYDLNQHIHQNSAEGKKRLGRTTTTKQTEHYTKRIACPHCAILGNTANMKRWHFDNCKLKPGSEPASTGKELSHD